MSLLNIMRQPCVYFGRSKSQGNDTKIGKSSILNNRKTCLDTSYSRKGFEFEKLILCETSEQESEIEDYLHIEYDNDSTVYLADHNGGEEWFNKQFATDEVQQKLIEGGYTNKVIDNPEIIKKAFEEYKQIYESNPEKHRKKIQELKEKRERNKRNRQSIIDENKWFKRQYQSDIIKLGIDKLNELGKFYLELATGAGKTYIVFEILKKLNPDIIFCLSPRLKINSQNISEKYTSILGDEYLTFNLSEDKNLDKFMEKPGKKIIVGCYRSYEKIYKCIHKCIHKHNIENPTIWFDEAHNCVEKWTDKLDDIIINYLLTNENIKYRIFTSASPDKDIVNSYKNIFGKLFNPISVKELMNKGYLCPLKPMMYYHNTDDVDLLSYSLDNFKELKRKWGLSFHNEQNNAKELFLKHLKLFSEGKTEIKPFLIVSEKYDVGRIDYEYDNITTFEETVNSVAYVVRKCEMGYDYLGIDYVIFSDRKMSYKDIIQCIGRGLRPDKLNDDGTNKDKDCILLLPVFIDDETKNKYKKVLEVLRYLILDLGIDVDEIIEPKYSNSSSRKVSSDIDYGGLNSIKAQIIDLLESSSIINPMNKDRLIKFCINHNIQNQKDYNEFKKLNPYLKLKDNIYDYKDFKWKPNVDPNSEIYYSSIEECEIKKEELFNRLESEKDDEEMNEIYENETNAGFKYLHTLDSKFPPYMDLTYFY
jgi:superfamily II DNA or RNA helicase